MKIARFVFAIFFTVAITVVYALWKKSKKEIDYSDEKTYNNKSFDEICNIMGPPLSTLRVENSELHSVWVKDKFRVTLAFSEKLVFKSIFHISILHKLDFSNK